MHAIFCGVFFPASRRWREALAAAEARLEDQIEQFRAEQEQWKSTRETLEQAIAGKLDEARDGQTIAPREHPVQDAGREELEQRLSLALKEQTLTRANEAVKKQQAQADKAYEIQTNIMQQQVVAESVRVMQVEKQEQIKVQEAEIQRRERELIATVLKQAEIERQRIETLAAAEKQRLIAEAEGHADATRTQGQAEAEIIFKKGEAEAKAMNVKAEAFQEYNQAAVIDKLLTGLPEVVRALSAPLANVDKITIVSTGNGDTAGMSKITGDMAKMAAQIPALFETLSGMQMSELLGKVKSIGDKPKDGAK